MKNKKLLVLVPFLLLMASCGEENNSNSDSISNSNSTSNSTNQSTTSEWKDELKTMMTSMLGETIPYFELGDYQFSTEEDSSGEYIYIYAESETDFVVEYTSVLTKAGYTDDGTEEDDYIAYFFVKGNITVQIDHYPGDTTYKARNEIFAWVEDNGGSDIPDTPTEKTDLTAWPTKLKELMTSTFNMEIPFVALAKDFEYDLSEGVLAIYDSSNVNFLENYGDTLVAANFVAKESDSDETYTHDYDDDYYIQLSFGFSESYDLGDWTIPGGNEINVELVQIIKEVETATWPEEEIKSVYSNLSKVTVPSFEVTGQYTYYFYGDGIVIYGTVSKDITNDYLASLGANKFMTYQTFDFSSFETVEFYYDWEEYVQVQIQYDSDNSKFYVQVYPMERSYDEFVTSFPEDKIKDFLGENATSVPAIDIKYGENIKYAHVAEDLEEETPEYIQLTYKDEGIVGSNSIMDEYLVTLRAQGWTIDSSDYDEYGYYVATSKSKDVVLTFESVFDIFILNIQKGE